MTSRAARELPRAEVCDCCGSDGILNRDLPPEAQAPIWTVVTFRGAPSYHDPKGLVYFIRKVCSDCNNRWQRMLLDDCKLRTTGPEGNGG